MILHNIFVMVRKGTFKSHTVVPLDLIDPYVSTFEHIEGNLKQEPAWFYTVDLLSNCSQQCRWSELLFFQLMILPFILIFSADSFVFSFPANHTCPLLLLCAMFCLSLCIKRRLCVEDRLACGSQLWVFKVVFDCQNFLISAKTECLVSWVTQIMTLLGESGPKDCNWTLQRKRASVCIH